MFGSLGRCTERWAPNGPGTISLRSGVSMFCTKLPAGVRTVVNFCSVSVERFAGERRKWQNGKGRRHYKGRETHFRENRDNKLYPWIRRDSGQRERADYSAK